MHANRIVVPRGCVKAHRHIGDREANAFAFQFGIGFSQCPKEVGTTEFAPHQIIRVIDDAHLVGLRVAHAQFGNGFRHHGRHERHRRERTDRGTGKMALPRTGAKRPPGAFVAPPQNG